jgi:tetratricopeptide (TPR) repeat protein
MLLLVVLASAETPLSALADNASDGSRRSAVVAYHRAIALERDGRFRAALTLLRSRPPLVFRLHHRATLRETIAAFRSAHAYALDRRPALAAAALREIGARLDPVHDAYLRAAQQRRLAAVTPHPPRPAPDPTFAERLWHDFTDAAEHMLNWLMLILAVALTLGAVWIAFGLYRWPRKNALGIAFEDLSADPSTRSDANQTLGRELSMAISAASTGTTGDAVPDVDSAKDLDGSGSVNVRVAGDELASINRLFGEDAKITTGFVSFNPRLLVAFAYRFVERRYRHTIIGSLVGGAGNTQLVVDLHRRGRRGKERSVRWSCSTRGSDSRAAAVAEVAQRVVFELSAQSTSDRWPSVAAYQRARALLAAAPRSGSKRPGALREVRAELELALAHDPANLLARYELGNVLRKLGSNDDAVAQYELLERLLIARRVTPLLRRTTAYSHAVALSKLDSWSAHHRAVEALERLRSEVEHASLRTGERHDLLALTRSAWAAAQLFELERIRDDRRSCAHARRTELTTALTDVRDGIVRYADDPGTDKATQYQALAVAENALGRALYLTFSGTPRRAIEAFDRALSYVPELGDAHVNLAAALLRKDGAQPGELSRICEHLDRALELSPNDGKALYLRGKIAKISDDPSSSGYFERAAEQGNPFAMFRLAELSWDKGRPTDALRWLQRSLTHGQRVGARAQRLIAWTAELDGKLDDASLAAAHDLGKELADDAKLQGATPPADFRRALRTIRARLRDRSGAATRRRSRPAGPRSRGHDGRF